MEIYRVPRHEVHARVLVDAGLTLEGTLFTAESGAGGRPEDLLAHLNDPVEAFVPLLCGAESLLLNKDGILSVVLSGEPAEEIEEAMGEGQRVPVQFSLTGGAAVAGYLNVVMPPERSRVVDYLNASGRFVPVFGNASVTLVQRRFIVSVRTGSRPAGRIGGRDVRRTSVTER